jgi:tRNA(Ile)-lysidine synthase
MNEWRLVDQWLLENTEASPLGTYHIITSRSPPPSPLVQVGIVTRILRYVSPEPWGSKKAEAERMSGKLFNIIRTIWPYVSQLIYSMTLGFIHCG